MCGSNYFFFSVSVSIVIDKNRREELDAGCEANCQKLAALTVREALIRHGYECKINPELSRQINEQAWPQKVLS